MNNKYSKAVEKLFTIGYTDLSMTWPNYVEELNLKEEHANDLIEIVVKSNLSHAISGFTIKDFAPRHAWRALGQLKTVFAAKPLLNALIIKKNEEAFDYKFELRNVLLLMGNGVIPELESFLNNEKIKWNHKVIIFETLVQFTIQEPIYRDLVIAISNDLLIKHETNYIFIARLLNALFKLNPIDSKQIKEIIDKDKYDFGSINQEGILKFIKNAKMYE